MCEKVDILDIGFKHQEVLFKNTQKLESFIPLHKNPQIIMSDFSGYWEKADFLFEKQANQVFLEASENISIIHEVSRGVMLGDILG